MLKLNKNYNFWTHREVIELGRQTVDATSAASLINDHYLELSETDRSTRRQTISIHRSVEKLNKHPSLLINKLRALA